jgi:hypothetical protein
VPLRRKAPTPDSSLFFFIGSLLYESTPPRLYAGGVRYLNILNILVILGSGEGLKSLCNKGLKKILLSVTPFFAVRYPLFAVRYPPFFVFSEMRLQDAQ